MKIFNKLICFVCLFFLVLGIMLSTVDFWCFNKNFYHAEYQKLNQAEIIGMSDDDLDITTDVLLNYLKDDNKTLDIQVEVNGTLREVFNEKEKAHMSDVRNLYKLSMTVRNISFVIFLVSMLYILKKHLLSCLFPSYKKILLIYVLIFSFICINLIIDFDGFWTAFHQVFFTNDLWLLNPHVDILIMMVPGQFFNDLCVRIVLSFLFIIFFIFLFLVFLVKKVFIND